MVTRPVRRFDAWQALEWLAVAASPAVLFFALRLQGMPVPELPDQSMHTTFIIDPRDIFTRYRAVFTPTARLREGAQVAFLVPARISYLLFGALGGFFVFRYVLALVAVVPAYLLLKRLYGRWAGFLAITVLLSSPVLIEAWGTDYPDSSGVSYLIAGLCLLMIPCSQRARPAWLAAAAAFLTLAIWSHGAAVPIVAASLVAYALIRILRQRRHVVRDAAVMVATAVGVTGILALLSDALLGQLNFITPTLQAERFLSRPNQEALWHSTNWRWVLYDPYLLILPATLAAFYLVFARRYRTIGDVPLYFAFAGLFTFATAGYLQFFGKVQTLEQHFLSSMQWSMAEVLFALLLAEMTHWAIEESGSMTDRPWAARLAGMARSALPALMVIVVALAYEADPHVPSMTLSPWGWMLAVIIVGVAALSRILWPLLVPAVEDGPGTAIARLATACLLIVLAVGTALILTVAPQKSLPQLSHVVADPPQHYAMSLGGGYSRWVDRYQVTSEIPAFVGHAAYRGEQLLMWWPFNQLGPLLGPIGLYHADFDTLHGSPFAVLTAQGSEELASRRPAQVLLISTTGRHFAKAVRALSRYDATVVRRGILSDGSYHVHLWLIDLGRFLRKT